MGLLHPNSSANCHPFFLSIGLSNRVYMISRVLLSPIAQILVQYAHTLLQRALPRCFWARWGYEFGLTMGHGAGLLLVPVMGFLPSSHSIHIYHCSTSVVGICGKRRLISPAMKRPRILILEDKVFHEEMGWASP